MKFKKLALILIAGICATAALADEKSGRNKITLTIAVALEKTSQSVTLLFILDNQSDKKFVTSELCTNHNILLIAKPNGEKVKFTEWENGARKITINPKEQKTWRLSPLDIPHMFDEAGTYSLQWQIGELRSQTFFLVKKGDSKDK